MAIFIYFIVFLVLMAAIVYILDYGYLINGISKTYLKGKASAHIDDGKFFSKNVIETKSPKPWVKANNYNKTDLPKNIVDDLNIGNTASFLVIKDGKLMHEQYWKGYNKISLTNSFSMAKLLR